MNKDLQPKVGKGTVCIRLSGWLFKVVGAQLDRVCEVFELRLQQGTLAFLVTGSACGQQ